MDDVDIKILNHGSIFLLTPCTERAEVWLLNNTNAPIINGVMGVRLEDMGDLMDAMTEDGLEVLPL